MFPPDLGSRSDGALRPSVWVLIILVMYPASGLVFHGVRRSGASPSTTHRATPGRRPTLRPTAPQGTEGQSPHPPPAAARARCARGEVGGATRGVTPRQTCPRPGGLGRNLRSKTRWFAGFCNSHQVSHFATFFIDARAEISVAESHKVHIVSGKGGRGGRSKPYKLAAPPSPSDRCVPWRPSRRGGHVSPPAPTPVPRDGISGR